MGNRMQVLEGQMVRRRARRLLRAVGVEPDDPADVAQFLGFLKTQLHTVAGSVGWPAWRRCAGLVVLRDFARAVREVSDVDA